MAETDTTDTTETADLGLVVAKERIELAVRVGDVLEFVEYRPGEAFEVDAAEAARLVKSGAARCYTDDEIRDDLEEAGIGVVAIDEDTITVDPATIDLAATLAEQEAAPATAPQPEKAKRAAKATKAASANPSIVAE